MSQTPSDVSIGIPATSSSGQLESLYERLYAQFHESTPNTEADLWLQSVEEGLRKPQLGNDTFEVLIIDEPDSALHAESLQAIHEGSKSSGRSWEMVAKVLMSYLYQAKSSWLHPKSIAGKPSLVEHHSGVVNRIANDYVSVCFGTGDDQFETEYRLDQFRDKETIARGDFVEAVIGLWHQKHEPVGIDRLLSAQEQQQLDAAWGDQRDVVRGDLNL